MIHNGSFLQSKAWEETNQGLGHQTFRVGDVLCIKIVARRGTFLLVPHTRTINRDIIELGRNEQCDFIRVCPLLVDTEANRKIFADLGFRRAPIHVHPEFAWILELKDDETLFAGMRKTTRYSIRKAEKNGIKTEISTRLEDIERFWKLYELTAERQEFTPFSKKYIEEEFRAFGDNVFWVFSEYAAAMIVLNDSEGFYHHGASTHHPTASYAVQWEAIKELRRRGRKWYNFWGVWNDPK